MPRVSVVIPTYRRAGFLPRAIASVTNQTSPAWELIVVDDNEPSGNDRRETEAIMAQYEPNPRIRYIRHERNQGGGAARNSGIRAASAPFVAFLDDDDEWHPTKLERQLATIEPGPADIALVYCRVRVVRVDTGRETVRRTDGRSHTVPDLLRRNTIGTTSCVLCRADALREVGLFDVSLPARQDQDLYLRLAQRYAFAFVDEVLVTLNVHGSPRISTDFDGSIRAHDLFYGKYRTLIEADPETVHVLRRQQGKHLIAARRFDEARQLLTKAVRFRPTDLGVWIDVALTFALPRALARPAKRAIAMLRGRRDPRGDAS
jgi:glycosyltransferase involved in cell wall biosynthesis